MSLSSPAWPHHTRGFAGRGCCCSSSGPALAAPSAGAHSGCACTELFPGVWISNQTALLVLGLHSLLLSVPFHRVSALGWDTRVLLLLAAPLAASPRGVFSCLASKLFEPGCKILLILLQIFSERISLGQ